MRVVELSEHTRVPLGIVLGAFIAIIPLIVGAVMWLAILYGDVASAKAEIMVHSRKLDYLQSIDSRLSRIEGKLGIDE